MDKLWANLRQDITGSKRSPAAICCAVVIAVLLTVVLPPVMADLTVVQDTGRTVMSVQHLTRALHSAAADDETPFVSFPVHTPAMTAGTLVRDPQVVQIEPWMTRPIFIVGSEPHSAAWLDTNNEVLTKLQASGLVISVPDVTTFKAMRRKSDLPLLPTQAPALVHTLAANGITHYPIVIFESGRVVQNLKRWHDEQSEGQRK